MSTLQESTQDIQAALAGAGAYIHGLPEPERTIAHLAAGGTPVWEIAQQTGMAEEAVWRRLGNVLRDFRGLPVHEVETGGLGSDTDPGVTGGYGDTGFGAFVAEEGLPSPEEPDDERLTGGYLGEDDVEE